MSPVSKQRHNSKKSVTKLDMSLWGECDSLFCGGAGLSSWNHPLPQLKTNTHKHTWIHSVVFVYHDFKLSMCVQHIVQRIAFFLLLMSLCFLYLFEENKYIVHACVHSCVCVCYLCVAGEAGPYYSRQELAVYGGGWDDLSWGHGGDALQSLLLGILVLHGNR